MKSIRWIKQVLIDGETAQLEIMMGVNSIADRCYVRINREPEIWFTPTSTQRHQIVLDGLATLKRALANHQISNSDGSLFSWEEP